MLLEVDHVRGAFTFAPFMLRKSIPKVLKHSPCGRVTGFGRVAGFIAPGVQLNNDCLIGRQSHTSIVKSKHSVLVPTFSVERLRTIRSPSSSIKSFVPLLFRALAVANARANLPVECFISFASALTQTAITATVNAVESSKKDSTLTGIRAVRTRSKCKRFYTGSSTVLRGGAFA